MYIVKLLIILLLAFYNTAHALDYSGPIESDHIIGSDSAKVVMIVYSSLSCPHCASFYNDIFPKIQQKYIDTQKVKYISRSIMTDRISLSATMLTYCNGEKDYFKILNILFRHFNSWASPDSYLDKLEKIAGLAKIDSNKFKVCMENTHLQDNLLKAQKNASEQLHIDTIPFILINGKKYQGSFTFESISKEIDKSL